MAWARYLWLLVPALGLAELVAHQYFATRAPEPGDWQQAKAPLAELRQADELVVVAPNWAEPLARSAFGEQLMPARDVTRPDASAYTRAIEVGILGSHSEELEGWRTVSEREVGGFSFRVVENPSPAKVRLSFVDALPKAEVTAGGSPCRWTDRARSTTGGLPGHPAFPRERFACGGGESFFVGKTVIDDEAYHPRRCIWAHPTPNGPLSIRFSAVPLGKVVRGYTGLPYLIFRDGVGAPVTLSVRANGRSLGSVEHHDVDGWHGFELSTGELAGETASVEFLVSSPNVKDRHFCFYADTR